MWKLANAQQGKHGNGFRILVGKLSSRTPGMTKGAMIEVEIEDPNGRAFSGAIIVPHRPDDDFYPNLSAWLKKQLDVGNLTEKSFSEFLRLSAEQMNEIGQN